MALSTLALSFAGAAILATSAAATQARSAELPALYVTYSASCAFTITDADGAAVSSVAPGTYQVTIITPIQFEQTSSSNPACEGGVQFELTGPGVNLSTGLNGTPLGEGCVGTDTLPPVTFQANSSYIAEDVGEPATQTTLTTVGQSATTPTTSSTSATSGASSSRVTHSQSLVGSEATTTPARNASSAKASPAKLSVTLSASGKLTLTQQGKAFSRLTVGIYTITVADKSEDAGVAIRIVPGGRPIRLTTAGFRGTRSTTLKLEAGIWRCYTSNGKVYSFRVTDGRQLTADTG